VKAPEGYEANPDHWCCPDGPYCMDHACLEENQRRFDVRLNAGLDLVGEADSSWVPPAKLNEEQHQILRRAVVESLEKVRKNELWQQTTFLIIHLGDDMTAKLYGVSKDDLHGIVVAGVQETCKRSK
jgi:hypothetical protein